MPRSHSSESSLSDGEEQFPDEHLDVSIPDLSASMLSNRSRSGRGEDGPMGSMSASKAHKSVAHGEFQDTFPDTADESDMTGRIGRLLSKGAGGSA